MSADTASGALDVCGAHLAIVLPQPGTALALPRYGLGPTYQARTLAAVLAQIAPMIARGVCLVVEDGHVAMVRQLAPTARIDAVACIACVGVCQHPPPAARARLRWMADGAIRAAEMHLPRQDGTRWTYRALIRPSEQPGHVVLDRIQPAAAGCPITHRRMADQRAAQRLARAWFAAIGRGARVQETQAFDGLL